MRAAYGFAATLDCLVDFKRAIVPVVRWHGRQLAWGMTWTEAYMRLSSVDGWRPMAANGTLISSEQWLFAWPREDGRDLRWLN